MQNEEIENFEYSAPPLKEKSETSEDLIKPTPDNPPWSSPAAVGVWVLSILAILFFPVIFLAPYILSNGLDSVESLSTNPTAIFLQVISVIPAHIFTLVLAWFVVTKFNKFSFKETLGWNWGASRWWNLSLILIGFFIAAGVVNYFLPEQENDLLRILRSSRSTVYAVAFLATFTAPIVEEVIYRGILYSALQRSIGIKGAIAIVTILFAGVHFLQYWGSPGTILLICLLSLTLTMIRVWTNNLLPCIVMHMCFNGIQSIFLILEPYLENLTKTSGKAAAIIHFFK
ncbi:MAG: type II CAAX endopeptidase family protein [Pyrinomonadaceae bacterium]